MLGVFGIYHVSVCLLHLFALAEVYLMINPGDLQSQIPALSQNREMKTQRCNLVRLRSGVCCCLLAGLYSGGFNLKQARNEHFVCVRPCRSCRSLVLRSHPSVVTLDKANSREPQPDLTSVASGLCNPQNASETGITELTMMIMLFSLSLGITGKKKKKKKGAESFVKAHPAVPPIFCLALIWSAPGYLVSQVTFNFFH